MIDVCTLFSGYDSQCMALERIGIDYDLVAWCEIERHAIRAHNAVYPQWAERNLGDICQVDWTKVPDFDLLTYSPPCQDLSKSGLQKGAEEGSGTRSSLLWECRKAIEIKRPKYLVMENVAALVNNKFIATFNKWIAELQELGYSNFAQVLNAKDYGIPQNRERIYVVSIRDCDAGYYFPKPIALTKRLKDVLETSVNERYFINEDRMQSLIDSTNKEKAKGNGFAFIPKKADGIANCITAKAGGRKTDNYIETPGCIQVMSMYENNFQSGRIYHEVGLSPSVRARSGGNNEPKIIVPNNEQQKFRIRKLTERECFRLMGVDDTDIDKIQAAGISKTQQYKLAGNSIVVDVLAAIFRNLFVDTMPSAGTQLFIF